MRVVATGCTTEWHLGACDNRYEPTYRGFDSFMGYLAGGEGYYNHRSDFRNGSSAGETPFCMGNAVANNYSSTLFAGEVSRIVRAHDPDTPMFMYLLCTILVYTTTATQKSSDWISHWFWYHSKLLRNPFLNRYLAFQSVHNPYEDPIDSGIPGTNVVRNSRPARWSTSASSYMLPLAKRPRRCVTLC